MQTSLEKINKKEIIIEIYGLGYVGLPLAIRLASSGFSVIGIDKDEEKINRLKKIELLPSEKNIEEDICQAINSKKLKFSHTTQNSTIKKISIVCVPTPIPNNNTTSDVYVKDAIRTILEKSKKGDIIILESSIEQGTTERIKNIIECYEYKVGENFGLAFCPERIDPQNKKWHLENIPRIIYCSDNQTYEICKQIYLYINNANLKRVSNSKVAEIVKSFENAFRLVNISLVNELAILCDNLKIDVKEVIDAAATKPFGFMSFYPGAGAGGHCIPKDPRFLLHSAKDLGLEYTTIEDALTINNKMPKYIANSIKQVISKNNFRESVIVCGLSYKSDIEDMRDSPGFKIIKELNELKIKIAAYDPFFKNELKDKYIQENNLEGIEFTVLKKLDKEQIKEFGCMCIVQHHTENKIEIDSIYQQGIMQFIYDCQNKILQNKKSKTILRKLGSS